MRYKIYNFISYKPIVSVPWTWLAYCFAYVISKQYSEGKVVDSDSEKDVFTWGIEAAGNKKPGVESQQPFSMAIKDKAGVRMKDYLIRLAQLKPFDESADAIIASEKYSNSAVLAVGVVSSAVVTFIAFLMAIFQHPNALYVLGFGICLSAITSGLEWSAGLKARACNQLFVCVIGSLIITALQTR